MFPIQTKLLSNFDKQFSVPEYATNGSAAVDLRAMIYQQNTGEGNGDVATIEPGQTIMIGTGIAISIGESDLAAYILPRSGLGSNKGLVLGNLVGLIDSDYQGELKIALWNRGTETQSIVHGERIAQLVFSPVVRVSLEVVDEFTNKTERGEGGHGSTGAL